MRTSRYSKRIIVSFRGSKNLSIKDLVPSISNNFDWLSNLNYFLTPMPTPVLIKDKMEEDLQDTVLVHKGFYSKVDCYLLSAQHYVCTVLHMAIAMLTLYF